MASDSSTGQCRSRWRNSSKFKLMSQKKIASENLLLLRMTKGFCFLSWVIIVHYAELRKEARKTLDL